MPGFDPFRILGLPERFRLTRADIDAAYFSRVASLHPDLATGGDSETSLEKSAELNRAKRVLENPEERADALLQALGGPSKEQDKSMPQGFLMEIMETRQEIEDALGDPSRLDQWRRWASEQRAAYVDRVGRLFDALGPRPDDGKLATLRRELNAWRYIERLNEQLDPRHHQL